MAQHNLYIICWTDEQISEWLFLNLMSLSWVTLSQKFETESKMEYVEDSYNYKCLISGISEGLNI